MIKCKTKDGTTVFVSKTYDCEPNLGGYYCQVYLDDSGNIELDNFTVSAELVDNGAEDKYIIEYVSDSELNCVYEMCPHCGNEVILEVKFKKQSCPICGELICPCSLCADCKGWPTNCPLEK